MVSPTRKQTEVSDITAPSKKGFTLIELIVVIAILAILSLLALPAMRGYREKSVAAVCNANRTSLTRYCKVEGTIGNTSLETIFADEKIQALLPQYPCPKKGSFSVKEAKILCSIHSASDGEAVPPSPPTGEPDWNQNYAYEYGDYKNDTTYRYGDVVERDGILYRYVGSDGKGVLPGEKDAGNRVVWNAIGSTDQSAIRYDATIHYAPGTIIEHNGSYYFFTPPYQDPTYSDRAPSDSSNYWTKITQEQPLKKPPANTPPDGEVLLYHKGASFQPGGYYRDGYRIYRYTLPYSTNSSIEYNSIANGTWTQVSTLYHSDNARYQVGDVVWYRGVSYRAKQNFTTYAANTSFTPAGASDYWEAVPTE